MITAVILSLLTLMIVLVAAAGRRRRRATRQRSMDIPLFVVPTASAAAVPRQAVGAPRPHVTPPAPHVRRREPTPAEGQRSPVSATIRTRDGAVSTLALPVRNDAETLATDAPPGEPVDVRSVRYWRVADGTLQFLPGRLRIASGAETGHEIRFVRTAGVDGTTVTFGRAEGPPYRHVQLREPTVSRHHARMMLESGGGSAESRSEAAGGDQRVRWRIENLSATNPVIVNGRALDGNGQTAASIILSEGDRIEMGEVAFVFHER